jgi:hypothetical protein
MTLRKNLAEALRDLSQNSYLLAVATVDLQRRAPGEIAAALQPAVQELCSDERPLPVGTVAMSDDEVQQRLPRISQFMTDVLLVEMQAMFHAHLMLASGRTLAQQAVQIESLLNGWAARRSPEFLWAYRDVILLTEIRNAVMHARGLIQLPNQRLCDAGWTEEELRSEVSLKARSFSDFLRFKRAVRTVANEILPDGE